MIEKIEKYEGWMLAKSTIHHGGNEKTGSTPILRTIFMFVDGLGEVPIPYVNGNAIRGKLRRLLMHDFFDILGVKIGELEPKVYHMFFTGGVLETTETSGVIDLELRRRIRSLLIPLSLMGCAAGNQMIPGKLKVGHAFPVCKEYSSFLPDELKKDERVKLNVRVFTDESFRTRRDDLKVERKKDEQAMQKKIDYECFIPGTKFYHWFTLEYASDIEKSCFGRMTSLFEQSPFIGGMAGTGNGEVVFSYKPSFPHGDTYIKFVKKHKDKIIKLIKELEEKL